MITIRKIEWGNEWQKCNNCDALGFKDTKEYVKDFDAAKWGKLSEMIITKIDSGVLCKNAQTNLKEIKNNRRDSRTASRGKI